MSVVKNSADGPFSVRAWSVAVPIIERYLIPILGFPCFIFISWMMFTMHPILLLMTLSLTSWLFSVILIVTYVLGFVGLLVENSRHASTYGPALRYLFYQTIRIFGKVFHGYTIHGLEHLTNNTNGLLIFYHILIPVDVAYVTSEVYMATGKIIGGVTHRNLTGYWNFLFRFMKFDSTKEFLDERLKAGNICAIAPGGEREAIFSQNYQIEWNKRVGFARVAKDRGIPVFPLFTANGQESMPCTTYGFHDTLLEVYEKTRAFFILLLIMLPVKLRIYIGEPLYCREDESPEEFAERVKKAIELLRDTHQRKPGSMCAAFLERFHLS